MQEWILDDNPFFTEKAPKGWRDHFINVLGGRRLQSIEKRLGACQRPKESMRDIAKVMIGASDVFRDDMLEVLQGACPDCVPDKVRQRISPFPVPEVLPTEIFDELYFALSHPFGENLPLDGSLPEMERQVQRAAHFLFTCMHYDPYWFAKKRALLGERTPLLHQSLYYERLSGFYAACEDLEVGLYLPAPAVGGIVPYYRLAGHLITGNGQIGLLLVPATKMTHLPKLRVTRGSPSPPGKLDFFSHVLTDMEPEIGRIGYESGLPYQAEIDERIGSIDFEVGYSIGGTIAQWRVAHNPQNLSSLWLYKSPGVPKHLWKRFNEGVQKRKSPLELHIFQAKRDIVDLVGEVCLGYEAPEQVQVKLYEMIIPRINTHQFATMESERISIEEVDRKEIDQYLSRRSKSFFEKQRKRLGEAVVVPLMRLLKKLANRRERARINLLRGLRIEEPREGNQPWETILIKK